MMQEIMDQEERVMLDQIAKLTEENHVEWACDEYNPIGILDNISMYPAVRLTYPLPSQETMTNIS